LPPVGLGLGLGLLEGQGEAQAQGEGEWVEAELRHLGVAVLPEHDEVVLRVVTSVGLLDGELELLVARPG